MFALKMETDNAAFDDGGAGAECARILRAVADRLEGGHEDGVLHDLNGNRVGVWSLELPDDDDDDDEDGCQTCREATETRAFPCDECGADDEDS